MGTEVVNSQHYTLLKETLLRAIVELEYARSAETLSMVSSSEGAAVIRDGMQLLEITDLSEQSQQKVRSEAYEWLIREKEQKC